MLALDVALVLASAWHVDAGLARLKWGEVRGRCV